LKEEEEAIKGRELGSPDSSGTLRCLGLEFTV
jgi:hypothetical protein